MISSINLILKICNQLNVVTSKHITIYNIYIVMCLHVFKSQFVDFVQNYSKKIISNSSILPIVRVSSTDQIELNGPGNEGVNQNQQII